MIAALIASRRALRNLVSAALSPAYTPEARDEARLLALAMLGGRSAYVAAVLAAEPGYQPRRHVCAALLRPTAAQELAAARAADAATARVVARARRRR